MSTVHKAADCIISGGTIRTMDPQLPEAEAVAISGERIVFVGDLEQARKLAGPGTETIDLRGKVALPGFVESHSHPILFGRYLEEVDCRNCSSLKEVTEALRKAYNSLSSYVPLWFPSTSSMAVAAIPSIPSIMCAYTRNVMLEFA